MATLYLASTKAYAGKTLLAVTLAKDAQRRGMTVRYFKPIGPYPIQVEGTETDNDALHVSQLLGLETPLSLLCPVPMTEEFRHQVLADDLPPLLPKVMEAFTQLANGTDLMLVGGMGSLFANGISYGLPSWTVADALDARVLVVSRFKSDRTIDELLAARRVLGDRMIGTVINAVRPDHLEQLASTVVSFLEKRGVAVYGLLPEEPLLHAISVRELQQGLNARVLCGEEHLDDLVERFAIGAMTSESAFSHFRKIMNKAVVTGGDRSDIICAALETSLRALVLTGGYEPAGRVLATASERGVPVLLAQGDTLSTVEGIDCLLEHLRFRRPEKIERAQELVNKHLDLDRLWKHAGAISLQV